MMKISQPLILKYFMLFTKHISYTATLYINFKFKDIIFLACPKINGYSEILINIWIVNFGGCCFRSNMDLIDQIAFFITVAITTTITTITTTTITIIIISITTTIIIITIFFFFFFFFFFFLAT